MSLLRRTLRPFFLATLCIAGCAPLQQAPLVYSSKISVGAEISSNAAESPGISISLGVKTVDAAYVPVAVSKKADDKENAGSKVTPDIIPLSAKYGEGSMQRSAIDGKRLADEYARAQAASTAIEKDLADASTAVDVAKRKTSSITEAIASVQGLGAAPIKPAPVAPAPQPGASAVPVDSAYEATVAARKAVYEKNVKPKLKALANQSIPVNAPDEPGDLAATSADLQAALKGSEAELEIQNKRVAALTPDAAAKKAAAEAALKQLSDAVSRSQTDRTDAFSVYGRFDSDTTANAPDKPASAAASAGASMLVGKVFSTGLASQNLTEANKVAAVASCMTGALKAAGAEKETDSARRAEMVTMVSNACKAKSGQ